MALLDKLNDLAAVATTKANSAIETGKLNLKIAAEEKKISEFTLNIGDLMVDKLDTGETFDDEIMALYASIQACREVMAAAREELNSNRPAANGRTCANCGAELAETARFCPTCGTKVEEPAPEVIEAEVVPSVCPQCGAELEPDAKFCTQCGGKTDLPPEVPVEEPAE